MVPRLDSLKSQETALELILPCKRSLDSEPKTAKVRIKHSLWPGLRFLSVALFSGMFGTIPRLKMAFLFFLESKAPSSFKNAPCRETSMRRVMHISSPRLWS